MKCFISRMQEILSCQDSPADRNIKTDDDHVHDHVNVHDHVPQISALSEFFMIPMIIAVDAAVVVDVRVDVIVVGFCFGCGLATVESWP
ncbi:MAG TPA: hypothetical protein VGQ81_10070 [Acidobacteriota bacterium]|nr:hypothetical protein [Acidobacteriota bacterium]